MMIRQVKGWIEKNHADKTRQEQDSLKRELLKRQKTYEVLSNKFSKQYKNGKITLTEMEDLSKVAYADFTAWALSVGYYEEINEAEILKQEEIEIRDIIKRHNERRAALGLGAFQWPS